MHTEPGETEVKDRRGLSALLWVMASALFFVGLSLLMTYPRFDPGSATGSGFGISLMMAWAGGLMVWALGMVKREGSQIWTLVGGLATLAISFGAIPGFGPPRSIQLGFLAISCVMVVESLLHRPRSERLAPAYRGSPCIVMLGLAGWIGIALSGPSLVNALRAMLKPS